MTPTYDPLLVALSVIVAMLASFAGLDLAGRVRSEHGGTRRGWIAVAATVMGLGIWSMHFVGMLAFRMPVPIWYDVPLMLLSMVVAIAASLLALVIVSRPLVTARTVVPGSVVMGSAIAGMHYIGMASLRADATLSYVGWIVVASVAIAILASLVALWLAFRFRSSATSPAVLPKILGAVVMGVAIAGMHYTAMAAARFAPGQVAHSPAMRIDASDQLAALVITITVLLVGLALAGAVVDRVLHARAAFTRELANRSALLGKSEERFRMVVDTALDAVIMMGSDGRITEWNRQAEKIFGWSRSEVVGRRLSETIIPHRHRVAHERGLAKFLETGVGPVLNRRVEIEAVREDGSEFPVELAIAPVKVGTEWTFSAFIRDLTERNRAAEALRMEEQRYRQLFENVPVGLYRSSPDGQVIDVNPAMVEMLGYPSRESLLATAATDLYVNADDRVQFTAGIAHTGILRDFTARMRRADGREIWVRENTHAKRAADGTIELWEGTLEDITEAMETAQRLQASERRLTQILEALPVGLFVADREGHFLFGNESARGILGQGAFPDLPITAHAGKYHAYVAGTDELYPVERMPVARALQGEMASADDVEIRRDGKTISLSVTAAPLFDDAGNVVAAVTVFTDDTERKDLEAQLRQALKMEAVGQLAGGIAHDFNNLLTVILSYGSMLAERLDASDPNSGDVREMTAAAERAAGLTRQLLAFSRKQVLQPQVIDVNLVVTNVETLLRRLIGEDITLQTDLESGIPPVNADPGQLEQVLMNLAINARDAMPDGGTVRISTAEERSSPQDDPVDAANDPRKRVVLTVSDTGSGMTSEVRGRVFDPFFTTKAPGEGTGLGLATVYGIVKQSGGDIRVRSEPGQGTSFDVYLPCADAPPRSVPAISTGAPRGSETILLVEDDPSLRTLAVRVLKQYGYNVIPAGSGPEALALSADLHTVVDGVLTDVIMPGMNGRELVDRLLAVRPGLPCLFMSGYTDDDVLRRGVLHGDSAFLQKPFTPDQLGRKIREVLDGSPRP